MERGEPSLVPEWLKGASGGGGAAHHSQPPAHQDDGGGLFAPRQRSSAASYGDFDSPRYVASSDRAFYPSNRRGSGTSSAGASDRPLFDRNDSYPRAYSSFGRSSGYRNYENSVDRDRDGPRERDWDRDYEPRDREFRDRDRDRGMGFGGGDDRDRDRDRPDGPTFRRLPSGGASRYEADGILRRSQSMGPNRGVENGDKKPVSDGSPLPTAPPTNVGSLTSSMQKAAFERNFPSLGAQEKLGAVQSSLGNLSVLSPRTSWQSSSPRPEGARTTPGSGLPGGIGSLGSSVNGGVTGIPGEGWSSALAEVPPSLTMNGGASGVISNSTATSGSTVLAGTALSLSSGSKMSDTVVQPPRVRTPPQSALESQRSDEPVWKQSRPFMPMASLSKSMGPRDKIKPTRAVDVVSTQPVKSSQPLASQLVSSPYRASAAARPELLKGPQAKLLVRKTAKDSVAGGLSSPGPLKSDGVSSSPTLLAPNVTAPIVGGDNPSVTAPGSVSASAPRKQRQLLDKRALPILATTMTGPELGSGQRARDAGMALEEKRSSASAQNGPSKSDLFTILRMKKAAGSGGTPAGVEKMEPPSLQKNYLVVSDKAGDAGGETSPSSENLSQTSSRSVKENGIDAGGVDADVDVDVDVEVDVEVNGDGDGDAVEPKLPVAESEAYVKIEVKEDIPSNGASAEVVEGNSDHSTAPSSPVGCTNLATTTEEEEAAFLKSLGWEESQEESGGLTEEEIMTFKSFYDNHSRTNHPVVPYARNHQKKDLKVGSIGSISSGLSSSDSESDDDIQICKRS